ncbi:hypothetical protein HU200_037013 [Digitaria exilis]|uniref:Protein kinase domain-containing protein n=1 Tax=Digitaria exilis TaxID=1010633 RepID=A0A835EHL4_9POAL|nr:hypothetical protein HU200_037013 [Digitaria exilis]
MDVVSFKQLRRLRTLGRGPSGAVVWLATDDASGQLVAVKSATGPAAAEQLRREARVLSGFRSAHIVPCLGTAHHAADDEYHLFLEFAPRGSLADEAARNGGRLGERDVRRYAADVAMGLAYLHGESVVHGDVKAANVVLGADGRAKLADFGCARSTSGDVRRRSPMIAGTPAFMAPEVARGEEQGPPADVWALACTVIEMATGAAPWSRGDTGGDVYAAVHKIAYTDAIPEVPAWLSSEAKDFLCICLERDPRRRPNAVELLDHPFIVSADEPAASKQQRWTSPKSTLDMAFWESDEEDEESESAAGRISSLASPGSEFPDWESEEEDDGWIDVHSCECSHGSEAAAAADTVTEASAVFGLRMGEALDAVDVEVGLHVVDVEDAIRYPTTSHGVGIVDDFVKSQQRHSSLGLSGKTRGCLRGDADPGRSLHVRSATARRAPTCGWPPTDASGKLLAVRSPAVVTRHSYGVSIGRGFPSPRTVSCLGPSRAAAGTHGSLPPIRARLYISPTKLPCIGAYLHGWRVAYLYGRSRDVKAVVRASSVV